MNTIYPKEIYQQYFNDMQEEYLKYFKEKKQLAGSKAAFEYEAGLYYLVSESNETHQMFPASEVEHY